MHLSLADQEKSATFLGPSLKSDAPGESLMGSNSSNGLQLPLKAEEGFCIVMQCNLHDSVEEATACWKAVFRRHGSPEPMKATTSAAILGGSLLCGDA